MIILMRTMVRKKTGIIESVHSLLVIRPPPYACLTSPHTPNPIPNTQYPVSNTFPWSATAEGSHCLTPGCPGKRGTGASWARAPAARCRCIGAAPDRIQLRAGPPTLPDRCQGPGTPRWPPWCPSAPFRLALVCTHALVHPPGTLRLAWPPEATVQSAAGKGNVRPAWCLGGNGRKGGM